jgi:methionyl-tRNA formyltransferase
MRFLFFGDGLWAANCLKRLMDDGHEALAVVMRRKQSDDTLAELARVCNLPVCVPDRVNDPEFVDWVSSLSPRINISVSYDQILRRAIRQSAPQGFINVHAGKLPYYRGRNPLNWAIINNETEIGLTVHYVDKGIDTGDIVLQRTVPLNWEDTYGTALEKVQGALPDLLAEAVEIIDRGEVVRQPQAHLAGSYFSRRVPGDEWIDWRDSSMDIYNKIRAITHPGPGARTTLDGRTLILWQCCYDPGWPKYKATPGEVVGSTLDHGARVKTGDSTVVLEMVQFEGEPHESPRLPIGTRFQANLYENVLQLREEVKQMRQLVREKVNHD